jgi:hypothetical protein
MAHNIKSKYFNHPQRFLIGSLAGLTALYALNAGCESKEESNGIDSKSLVDILAGEVISQAGEEVLQSCEVMECLSFCNKDYYVCDEFNGDEVNTTIWDISKKGDIGYLVGEGYLTISNSGNLDASVILSSVQTKSLVYEVDALTHSMETKAKLDGGSILYFSDGLNGCVVFNADNCAVCGETSIYESDACTDPVEDTDGWHTYATIMITNGNGEPRIQLFQDGVNKITDAPAIVSYGEHALHTAIGCFTYDTGSCQFDYVRGLKSDVFF